MMGFWGYLMTCFHLHETQQETHRIREIVRIVQESGVAEVTIEEDDLRVTVRRTDDARVMIAAPAAPLAAARRVRTALDKTFRDAIIQSYGDASLKAVMVRVPTVGAESGTSLSTTAQAVEDALKAAGLGTPKRIGAEAQAIHHAGRVILDQNVGFRRQVARDGDVFGRHFQP